MSILVAYYFVDKPIVYFASAHHFRDYHFLDTLTQIPKVIEIIAYFSYMVILVALILNLPIKVFMPIFIWSTSVALTGFLNKTSKIVFSRYWPETWIDNNISLLHGNVYGFNWFHGGNSCASFPSGHTSVTVAAMTVLSVLYPQLRWIALIIVGFVVIGLISLYYHFLSDVIAGGLLGYFTAQSVMRMSAK